MYLHQLLQCLTLSDEELQTRLLEEVDIAFDELSNQNHYKKEEDPKFFKSEKTGVLLLDICFQLFIYKICTYLLYKYQPGRGPLIEGWRSTDKPIMCSYKLVNASFEVWGLQTKVEDFIQRSIRDVLLLGHRQAFTWIDEWYDMTLADVRAFERQKQAETNEKLKGIGDN